MSEAGHTERLEAALDGKYRIERKLGEGGMASVYLAEDIKHERKVALKILRPELAAVIGSERFLAEIKTTAALQHPHILPLHDSGEADGYLYYVMPYIDGETLREKLDREKQLGVEEAVRIARDVADALDYAHRAGVIHRDIKPGNILLHDGRPVVADFGIALAVSAAGGGRMTETGLSLGTPHYMSPEQASADRDLSARSDVYSLGCVLYEMLAGQPPHTGPSAQSILVHILTEEPKPLTALRHTVPPNVAATVAKSIEKLPADRFETAREFVSALEDATFAYQPRPRDIGSTQAVTAAVSPVRSRHSDRRVIWSLGVAAVMTVLAAWGWLRPTPGPVAGVTTRALVPGMAELSGGGGQRLGISPDGRLLYKVDQGAIHVRAAEDPEWRRLPNTDGASAPTFSPDGRWIAFDYGNATRGIARISVDGGPALPVVDTGRNPHWGADNTIVYSDGGGGLMRVPFTGGDAELLTESETTGVRQPHILPNGKGVLFSTGPASTSSIALYEMETGSVHELVPSGNDPQYLPTGHVVYGHRDGALMGVPFDLETLEVTGAPVTLLPSLAVFATSAAQFGVSDGGTLVYATARGTGDGTGVRSPLYWVDSDGQETPVPLQAEGARTPRLSPTGDRIAYSSDGQIWIYRVDTGTNIQLTFEGANRAPVWSPDGRFLYFMSERPGTEGWDAFRKAADGASNAEHLWSRGGEEAVLTSVSSDERWLVVGESDANAQRDISLAVLSDDSVAFNDYLRADWSEYEGVVSPNGRWMAYTTNETGDQTVIVRGFPEPVGQWRISTGFDPVWARDGSALFFVTVPWVMKVDVQIEGTFSVGQPVQLFPWTYDSGGALEVGFDVHPDGDRFIFASLGNTGFGDAYIVTDWFEELRERMGEN